MGDVISWMVLIGAVLFYVVVLPYVFWKFIWKKSKPWLKILLAATLAVIVASGGGWFAWQQLRGREKLIVVGETLQWGEYSYESFGYVPDGMIGKPFGRIEGNRNARVYLCEGYPPEHWLVGLTDTEMGLYYLLKEDSVKEIPDGFISWEEFNQEAIA